MVIDSSALLAILLDEPEAAEFLGIIKNSPARRISAASFLETGWFSAAIPQGNASNSLKTSLPRCGFPLFRSQNNRHEPLLRHLRSTGKVTAIRQD
jgi:uncharacterized protein with PIN domain